MIDAHKDLLLQKLSISFQGEARVVYYEGMSLPILFCYVEKRRVEKGKQFEETHSSL